MGIRRPDVGLVPGCTKRKAACVATSGPSLGRKRPRRAAIAGGLPHTLQIRRSRLAAQLNVGRRRASKRVTDRYEGLPSTTSARRRPSLSAHYVEHRARHHRTVPASSAHHHHRATRPPLASAISRHSIAALLALGLFGQPRFPKALDGQLRVRLPATGDKRRDCKARIELNRTRRRLTRLSVTSEMGESGRETAVSCYIGGVLTLGFLPCDDGLVKATKLNKGIPHPGKRRV